MKVLDSVLLVDDDEAANFFHKSLIKKLGIADEIYETRDGREAYDFIEHSYYASRRLPSLILIDIAMPGMDGKELIKELKSSRLLSVKRIPIAVVTSSESERDIQAIHQLGNFPYITKPLNEIKFFNILENAVAPSLYSNDKKRYINQYHQLLDKEMQELKQQHQWLKDKQQELNKYMEEVREKINKFKNKSGENDLLN